MAQQKFGYRVILVGIFCKMKNPIKQGKYWKMKSVLNLLTIKIIFLIFTFQKTIIAKPFQGKFPDFLHFF